MSYFRKHKSTETNINNWSIKTEWRECTKLYYNSPRVTDKKSRKLFDFYRRNIDIFVKKQIYEKEFEVQLTRRRKGDAVKDDDHPHKKLKIADKNVCVRQEPKTWAIRKRRGCDDGGKDREEDTRKGSGGDDGEVDKKRKGSGGDDGDNDREEEKKWTRKESRGDDGDNDREEKGRWGSTRTECEEEGREIWENNDSQFDSRAEKKRGNCMGKYRQ